MTTLWRELGTDGRLSRLARHTIAAARGSDEEVCGLLYPDGAHRVPNISPTPRTEYAMDPDAQVALMATRGWPEAVFHTHPGGRRGPSSLDHASALPGVPYLIGTPDGWAGVWRDGRQILEVMMSNATNDTVEVYEDKGGEWRWRRTASNGATISGSEESFSSKEHAARAAERANPDAYDNSAQPEGAGVADAIGGGGTGGQGYSDGGAGPTGPGMGAGGNSSGVGPTTTG